MSDLTDYAENKLTDALLRGQAIGTPATWYVALFTAAPSDAGGGTEVTGGSYARASFSASLANWSGTQGAGTTAASSGTGGASSNNAVISFPTPSAGWGTVTHFALMDASTSGNMWIQKALTASKTINSGDTVRFDANTMTLTIA